MTPTARAVTPSAASTTEALHATHRSTTDPEARLYKKGGLPAQLCCLSYALMENRHGLAVDGCVTLATGTAEGEGEAALAMLDRRPGRRRPTLGTDKAYDVIGFIRDLRAPGHAAHRHRRPPLQHRQAAQDRRGHPHHLPRRLCGQPALPQAH